MTTKVPRWPGAAVAASIAVTWFSGPAAHAEGWNLQGWERTIEITGSSKDEFTYSMYTLNTTDTDKPGMMFSCSEKYGLNILYSYRGVDFIQLFTSGKSSKLRSIPVNVWVGDGKRNVEYFFVRRKDKVLSNQESSQAAAAFRALLRNQTVRIKASGMFDVTFDAPNLDGAVANFLSVCDSAQKIASDVRTENPQQSE